MKEETTAICAKCGKEFTYIRHGKSRVYCDDCAEKRRASSIKYYREHKEAINAKSKERWIKHSAQDHGERDVTKQCSVCGQEFTYHFSGHGKGREVCDDCRTKQQKDYHTKYNETLKSSHQNVQIGDVYSRKCKQCGKIFTAEYSGRLKLLCDDCLAQNRAMAAAHFGMSSTQRARAAENQKKIKARAAAKAKSFSEILREATARGMSYGKYVVALERGENV